MALFFFFNGFKCNISLQFLRISTELNLKNEGLVIILVFNSCLHLLSSTSAKEASTYGRFTQDLYFSEASFSQANFLSLIYYTSLLE